jgi:carbonic anhydrase
MQKLIQGVHHFQSQVFSEQKKLFDRLSKGQSPEALFITCSDSRVCPNLLTQTQPGELFIIRNAGNIVPPYDAIKGGEQATIEYAVNVLGVRDIIICGHSLCGAMQGLLNPNSLDSLPSVKAWLTHAEQTRQIIDQNYRHLTDSALLTATVEENVLTQLENLCTHPSVAQKVATGEINLHAWVYKIETGEVFSYNPEQGQFVALTGPSPLSLESIQRTVEAL